MTRRERGKRVLTTVHLDPEQHEALKAISARTRIPTAVLIREAVDVVVAKYGEPAKGQPEAKAAEVLAPPNCCEVLVKKNAPGAEGNQGRSEGLGTAQPEPSGTACQEGRVPG